MRVNLGEMLEGITCTGGDRVDAGVICPLPAGPPRFLSGNHHSSLRQLTYRRRTQVKRIAIAYVLE